MYQQYLNSAQASLHKLSSDELKELLNDDEKLEEKINESVKSIENDKERLLENNRVVAEENLSKEPKIIEMRAQVNELADKGKELCSSVQEKITQIKSKSGNLTQDTALALLQTAGAESEETSEKIVKQLLDNEITVEIFLEQFISMRKTMHLRKIKADKMNELIRQPNIRGTGSPYPPAANTGFYPSLNPMGGGGVPYPMGPMMNMMPMAPTGYRNY